MSGVSVGETGWKEEEEEDDDDGAGRRRRWGRFDVERNTSAHVTFAVKSAVLQN